jgi:hypothetical protein
LLPADFSKSKGGTMWAPDWLNKNNQAAAQSYVPVSACQYLVLPITKTLNP